MRKPPGSGTGPAGRSKVVSIFEEANWGVSLVPEEHDVGTDLLIAPRDDAGNDMKSFFGVQVKTSKSKGSNSYFKSPHSSAHNQLDGWWFTDTNDHFEYWCNHRIPHILVLVDLETDDAFWVHLRGDDVRSSTRFSKILVPASNSLSLPNLDLIKKIALAPPEHSVEGTIWDSAADIDPGALIRTAMLVPRLVSLHPNRVDGELQWHQAIAMLVQLRIDELDGSALHQRKPLVPPDGAGLDVHWRMYYALRSYLTTGEVTHLIALDLDGASPAILSAHAALLCAAHMENNDPAHARDTAEKGLRSRKTSTADKAWLSAHLAWAYLELGNASACAELAGSVESSLQSTRDLSLIHI